MDERDLLGFEARVRRDTTNAARSEVDALVRDATLVYLAAARAPGEPISPFVQQTIRVMLLGRIDRLISLGALRRVLLRAVREGVTLGLASAFSVLGRRLARPRVVRSPQLRAGLNQLGAHLRQDLRQAKTLARVSPLETFEQLQVVLSAVRAPVARAERTATWVANRSIAEGVRHVTQQYDVPTIWIAERDACLHCLAYAGQVVQPGQLFPGGLTYGDRPLGTEPVSEPPLHPNCRCRLQPWLGSEEEVGPVDLPQALRREAQRTVAQGSANASEPARLRAADRLLQRADLMLSRTAVKRARKAIADRKFIDRRRPR